MVNPDKKNDMEKSTLNQKEALFMKKRKTISVAIIAAVFVIAGIICYKTYISGPREQKASTALAAGQEYFANQQFDKALKGDGAGYAGFISIASDYGNTDAGNLANLYAGLCYAGLDKWNDAIKYLDAYSPSDDQMISPASMAALGNAYAHVKQLDKAVSYLKKAAKMADDKAKDGVNYSLSPIFLIQAGEILESQNKKDEALKIYNDIKEKYINSPISGEIDKYIERVSVK